MIDHAARFATRTSITMQERDMFRNVVVQCKHERNAEACSAGDALTATQLAVHQRRAVRQALVELGYLDIIRRSIPQPNSQRKTRKNYVRSTGPNWRPGGRGR